jgi:DNA topoisomerase VI subunit A
LLHCQQILLHWGVGFLHFSSFFVFSIDPPKFQRYACEENDQKFRFDCRPNLKWRTKSVGIMFSSTHNRFQLMEDIENIMFSMIQQINEGKSPQLLLPSRRETVFDEDAQVNRITNTMININFCFHSMKSFGNANQINLTYLLLTINTATTLSVLNIIHELLLKNIHVTKRFYNIIIAILIENRDIYYSKVNLFGNQRRTDDAIENLASLLSVPRNSLHVVLENIDLIISLTFW